MYANKLAEKKLHVILVIQMVMFKLFVLRL